MITIQNFAKLAGTTKRTLSFYDEKDLFKPKFVADNGYRYYDYDQLYEVTFILALRNLGLSIDEIKALNSRSDKHDLDTGLKEILTKINTQIDNLTILKETLNTRFNAALPSAEFQINRPIIIQDKRTLFCRSKQSVACTNEEIAEIYSDFYEKLGKTKLVDKQDSGFLTQLPNSDANLYPTASFCILKEISEKTDTGELPIIEKRAGQFVSIDTTNDVKNICIALQMLAAYIKTNNVKISADLWQMNLGDTFTSKGSSALVRLQYEIQ